MTITDLIWLENIVEKLAVKHQVDTVEVREVFDHRPHIRFVEKGHRVDENVYAAFGQTIAGRYLIVFFVMKHGGQALILSARDMTQSERRRYERR